MELDTLQAVELICSAQPPAEFIYHLNGLCAERSAQFETWLEILFLKTIREKDQKKILNIANNLAALRDGADARQIFYNIIISSFSKGVEDDFIFLALSRFEALPLIVNFLSKIDIPHIKTLVSKLSLKQVVPEFILYTEILKRDQFYTIGKFTELFDDLNLPLKQQIVLTIVKSNDYSLCSRLNTYFESNPFTLNSVFYGMLNDYNEIIIIISDLPFNTLTYSLSSIKNLILKNCYYIPYTIDKLLVRSINEKSSSFIFEAAQHISKRKIIDMLYEHNAKDIVTVFLSRFRDDPEIEHFIPFA